MDVLGHDGDMLGVQQGKRGFFSRSVIYQRLAADRFLGRGLGCPGVGVGYQGDSCNGHCSFSRSVIHQRLAANSFLWRGWG